MLLKSFHISSLVAKLQFSPLSSPTWTCFHFYSFLQYLKKKIMIMFHSFLTNKTTAKTGVPSWLLWCVRRKLQLCSPTFSQLQNSLTNFELAFATFHLKYLIKLWYWKGTYNFISKSYPFTYYFTPFLYLAKILLRFKVQKYAFFWAAPLWPPALSPSVQGRHATLSSKLCLLFL